MFLLTDWFLQVMGLVRAAAPSPVETAPAILVSAVMSTEEVSDVGHVQKALQGMEQDRDVGE